MPIPQPRAEARNRPPRSRDLRPPEALAPGRMGPRRRRRRHRIRRRLPRRRQRRGPPPSSAACSTALRSTASSSTSSPPRSKSSAGHRITRSATRNTVTAASPGARPSGSASSLASPTTSARSRSARSSTRALRDMGDFGEPSLRGVCGRLRRGFWSLAFAQAPPVVPRRCRPQPRRPAPRTGGGPLRARHRRRHPPQPLSPRSVDHATGRRDHGLHDRGTFGRGEGSGPRLVSRVLPRL